MQDTPSLYQRYHLLAYSASRRFGGTYRLHLQGRKAAGQETTVQHVTKVLTRLNVDHEDGGDSFSETSVPYGLHVAIS
jgi:hypothetical protein